LNLLTEFNFNFIKIKNPNTLMNQPEFSAQPRVLQPKFKFKDPYGQNVE